jgi:hypothetical protein
MKKVKEIFRKLLVSLKRRPQIIPMIALAVSFLVYSLNLMNISDTTAKIQGPGMGICGFATMLFSLLSFLCFLNAFPRRKKVNVPMLVLMFLMIGVIIFCDLFYLRAIGNALSRPDNPIQITKSTVYIALANNMLNDHIVLLGISVALVALLPVYGKLLRKINTSINVEDNGKLDAIDISGEE